MSVLVDTNILVYAANAQCPEHTVARQTLEELRAGDRPWFLTWGVIYEFLRVVTHPAVSDSPLSASAALLFVGRLLDSPQLAILLETDIHLSLLKDIVKGLQKPAGNLFHDAHIAALMREHGIREILTADRGFRRFKHLLVWNPLHQG